MSQLASQAMNHEEVREAFHDMVSRELLGPCHGPEEELDEKVSWRYLVGWLAPRNTAPAKDDVDDGPLDTFPASAGCLHRTRHGSSRTLTIQRIRMSAFNESHCSRLLLSRVRNVMHRDPRRAHERCRANRGAGFVMRAQVSGTFLTNGSISHGAAGPWDALVIAQSLAPTSGEHGFVRDRFE